MYQVKRIQLSKNLLNSKLLLLPNITQLMLKWTHQEF